MTATPPTLTAQLATAVLAQKALARRNHTARTHHVLAGTIAGIVGATIWVSIAPETQPNDFIKGLIGAGLGALVGYVWMFRPGGPARTTEAACPSCGHDWMLKETRRTPPQKVMTNWDSCPGCGCCMNDALLNNAAAQPPLPG
jgi:NAD-dependent dihydropyrimidine dehydrogenase PreA subunit